METKTRIAIQKRGEITGGMWMLHQGLLFDDRDAADAAVMKLLAEDDGPFHPGDVAEIRFVPAEQRLLDRGAGGGGVDVRVTGASLGGWKRGRSGWTRVEA